MMYTAVLLPLLAACILAAPRVPKPTCGYESCTLPKEGNFLNLHFVAHTHDDVGWLKTYDEYYYGNNNTIQEAGVQYILDSVVQELLQDPQKKFIYVETAYFWKWWMEQHDSLRHQVKRLVNNGQLEFVGGAWSMHDEAAAHYHSMLDQTTWGFRKLVDTFGKCGRPRVGWQIDPFGHSKENANLMAKYGFDGLFLGRLDWEDKGWRVKNQTMEFIWHTSSSDNSEASKLFTGVLYNTYSPPNGFCFDVFCQDEPIVDNKRSPKYNAEARANEFVRQMLHYAKAYRTNNVLITMGNDFNYVNAHMNFKNMDKLIRQINKMEEVNGLKMNAFYSTPSCYLKAVNNLQIALPTKSDDFMPYSSDPYSFWTGYYSSRPTSKNFERKGNNFLQVCKQLYALSGLGPEARLDLNAMRESMGIMQHHDAITGTEKQHVADDYARILTDSFNRCGDVAEQALNKLMQKNKVPVVMKSCLLSNISSCPITENNDNFVVTVYNPLSRPVNHLVRLPVLKDTYSYTVLCPMGKKQEMQVMKLPKAVQNIPGRESLATAQLEFIARGVPPLGYKSFYVSRNSQMVKSAKEIPLTGQPMKIGFDQGVSVTLDGKGELTGLEYKGKAMFINQTYLYYNSALGNNEVFRNRSSGAYIFRPNGTAIPVSQTGPTSVKIFKGVIVAEIFQTYSDWVSQVIRLRRDVDYFELEWLVGPIPINDGKGKEVISRFITKDIQNNGEFLTDSNGREYLTRKVDYRPCWPVNLAESVPGNYYPVTTTLSISDEKNRMSVITDRAQGGSSLDEGQMELMVHRRILHDDAFGVGEALNETAYGEGLTAIGSHFLTVGNLANVRQKVQERILDSWTFVSPTQGIQFSSWQNLYKMEFSALKTALPSNVQILTLEPWKGSSFLFRLEHIMATMDDPELSKPVTINLKEVFAAWTLKEVEELMLGADLKVTESVRLPWQEESDTCETFETLNEMDENTETQLPSPFVVTLKPMDIRTFIIHIK